MHSKRHDFLSSLAEYTFLVKLFRAGQNALVDLIHYQRDKIDLVLAETSCVSYPGYIVLF